jgi:hypothetical protein
MNSPWNNVLDTTAITIIKIPTKFNPKQIFPITSTVLDPNVDNQPAKSVEKIPVATVIALAWKFSVSAIKL